MDCPIGCGFDLRILLLAIGALLLGLLTLLSLVLNIGGVMMLLRRFKVSLDIQPRADEDRPDKKSDHSVLATWLFGLFVLSLIAIAVALIASG